MSRVYSHLLPLVACVGLLLSESSAIAQTEFFTFTSGPAGDGFVWDYDTPPSGLNDLPDGDTFITPFNPVNFGNFSGNVTFFDDNYLVAANSSVIQGEAWWGNPIDGGGEVELGFFNLGTGISTLDFDFSWAIAGEDAPDYLELIVIDEDSGPEGEYLETFLYLDLNETFNAGPAYGNSTGRAGHISIDYADLFDDSTEQPFSAIDDVYIGLYDIETLGGTSEFAIDNVNLNGATVGGSNVFPSVNGGTVDVSGSTILSFWTVGAGTATHNISVTNNGTESTQYTTELVPGGDLTDGGQVTGGTINAGETVFGASTVTLNRNQASGVYQSDILVTNDVNASDSDDTVTMRVTLHLAQQLTSNNSSPIEVDAAQQITISNAAAPASQFRAGVKVTGSSTVGPFAVTGFAVDDQVLPGAGNSAASALFNRYGRLTAIYQGTFTLDLAQVSQDGYFMLSPDAVPSEVWNLEYDLADLLSETVAFASAETYGPNKIGVNNAQTAATLVAGEASTAQTVQMNLGANPEAGGDQTALVLGSALDLDFSTTGDLYVLQMTYDDTNIPSGFSENELLPLYFDGVDDRWIVAMDANSNGGAGAQFITSSFDDFLAGLGEDPLPLSTFGLDTANNQIWAILDHASQFAVGVPLQEGDMNGDGVLDEADINLFVMALVDRPAYDALNLQVNADVIGDINGSGDFNLGDVADFKSLFSFEASANSPAVPEPSSCLLLALMGLGVMMGRRSRGSDRQ